MSRFGATILDADGLALSREEVAVFREANPFGFILFARNIDTPDQVRRLCDQMREAVGRAAPITIDQEGGRVQRLRGPTWTDWTPPLDFVTAAGDRAEEAMYLRYRLIAAELHALGIDSNCAPMVDLAGPQTHDFLRNRCYGARPKAVARLGRAAASGLLAGGVLPVLKHIPGHGRATLDSHYDLPEVEADAATLAAEDFAPFKALADLPMGMTAHLVYRAYDTAPATLSPRLMQVIRDEIGFDNLIMTDDISMKALSGTPEEIATGALAAGCDVVLQCNAPLEARRRVAEAAGEMTEAAQIRAERALAFRKPPDDIDIVAARAQLDTLLAEQTTS
ncbi:beta-N-acetylhexosaminidase [Roseobacter sinensis]|uniref:beta-N-acetylhexosaminidase n=1 Tax=Roseobacter sinensis TaxID=2931391 RepID=A0ABT3BFM0_9RHOB|nr:beta-N-acetylhexosaminidase [Roseobacter sp. WL0113]MCV3272345.1 beta-N-acetylhexosaminidase [Roseobacter sp. WL0113]